MLFIFYPNIFIQIFLSKYFYPNIFIQIFLSKYFYPNIFIQIFLSKYFDYFYAIIFILITSWLWYPSITKSSTK